MSGGPAEPVLLGTCASIWVVHGDPVLSEASQAIVHAGLVGGVLVSPASAWEVSMLATKPKGPRFLPDAKAWFAQVLTPLRFTHQERRAMRAEAKAASPAIFGKGQSHASG